MSSAGNGEMKALKAMLPNGVRPASGGKKRSLLPLLFLLVSVPVFLTGCGKTDAGGPRFEIVDGKVVDNGGNGRDDDVIFAGQPVTDPAAPDGGFPSENGITAEESGSMDLSAVNEGQSYSSDDAYNSIGSDTSGRIDILKLRLTEACSAVRDIYRNADKGTSYNVTISSADLASMISACGAAGFPTADSRGDFNMQGYGVMHEFGQRLSLSNEDVSGTYFIIYPDGHLSGFMLSRERGLWHLYSASAAWNEDGTERIYSEGRYAVGEVRYTEKGWLIYSRDTSDFDENQKANTDSYVMVRVLPYDDELRVLCKRYVEPVGYFENNLFTTTWNESNMGVIDFNSLYAYVFSLYNGTDMLSSYNVRSYYKSVQGSRLYLVPEDIFENNTTVYFRIDRLALRNISDYSSSLGGYLFLGYNRDYYNVTPRTPTPEVVSCTKNNDGTLTLIVDAVNPWYGTDRAFRHELRIRPTDGVSFNYVSNTLYDDPNNILPQMKLAELLNVELTKTDLGN